MKNILKLSLVSLCASGAIFSTQANDNQSASNIESDKQLVVTEPAGANASTSISSSSSDQGNIYQSTSTSMQSPAIYEASGASIGAPRMVTGRDQDAYADCILHQYQAGKGSARVTDDYYWNNVQSDRMYAQYPASGGFNQNVAYNSSSSFSSGSRPMASSSSWGSAQMGEYWYGPGGAIYKSSTSSERVNEPAGSSIQRDRSSDQGSSSSSSSGLQSSGELKKGGERQADSIKESAGAEPSATQAGTSGYQSSTESKSSQSQPGTATQEAAGATSGTENQPSASSTSTSPDQSSTQSSTSGGAADMSEKVRSTLKSDTALSPISSNVTVQDQNGKVALNGTVKSEAEKQQIVSKAEETAGSGNVIDNLQIKSDSSNP